MKGGSRRPEARTRLRAFLTAGAARPDASSRPDRVVLRNGSGTLCLTVEQLRSCASEGLLRNRGGLIELAVGSDETGTSKAVVPDPVDGEPIAVMVRNGESPLATLARLRDRNGSPFLAEEEFRAGERLRADYTRGRIMPRLGVNWDSARSGGGGGIADLTDAALAARQRVDAALRAVGPELSGLLVDVCCFLKGLEQVERERGWPVRSAKVVVKTALAALARHYGPPARSAKPGAVLHWGAEDFRPRIGGAAS